jgi:5'-3' exonuclease
MGVPSFFAWWAKLFPDRILFGRLPFKKFILYLDFNGGIHPAVRTDEMMPEDVMTMAPCSYLDKIIDHVQPDEVWIAIDGVAPIAKLSQQRERRFKSPKESKAKREFALEHNEKIRQTPVDFNMISPGTEFMNEMERNLAVHIEERRKGSWKHIKFSMSGSGIPGEGEHKIMDEIRLRKDQGIKDNICVYGLDADLLFLTMENAPEAFLVRENVKFYRRDEIGLDKDTYPFIYCDVQALAEIVTDTLDPICRLPQLQKLGFKYDHRLIGDHTGPYQEDYYDHKLDQNRLVRDYIFICFLLGNDFIPRLPCLKIRNGSLNNLVVMYKKIAWSLGTFLVNTDLTINRTFFHHLIKNIADLEDEFMIQASDRRDKDTSRFKFRLRGKSRYECAIEQFDYIENQYEDTIKGGTPGWRVRYYDYHLGISYRHEKEYRCKILPICEEYLKGMNWVLQYYTGSHSNWTWSYPYDTAPTARDLLDSLSDLDAKDFIYHVFEDNRPVEPYVQLLSILPPDSAHLLPATLRPLMTDRDSPIHYMYPFKITLSLIGNKFWHECKPRMPHVDHKLLKSVVAAKYKYLTDGEKNRNTIQQIKVF